MGRSQAVLGLCICLAACATAPGPATEPVGPSVQYLDGIETDFARRLDGISTQEELPAESLMRHAVIAGDEDLWIAATVFRRGDYYTMDMIVLNHGEDPIRISRDDLRLVDLEGRWLSDVSDWEGAQNVGLRGKSARSSAPRFVYDAPIPQPPDTELGASSAGEPGGKARTSRPTASVPAASQSTIAWRADFVPVAPAAPRELDVAANTSRAYWAYWQADEVAFPLTAFVMLGDRHMMFQFGL